MKLVGKTNSPSARALLGRLGEACPITVRWGGVKAPGAVQGDVSLLDGIAQLKAFQASGLPCPEFTTDYKQALAWCEAPGIIVLGRNRCHSQGFDIIPHWAKHRFPTRSVAQRFAKKDFWVKLVPKVTSEWRVHVMRSQRSGTYYSIAMGQKNQVNDVLAKPAQQGVILRSRRLGWHLRHDTELPPQVRELAKQAVAALKYDFGAVDIVCGANGPVVLEVNSCPALRDDYTLDRYAGALQKYWSPKAKKEGVAA